MDMHKTIKYIFLILFFSCYAGNGFSQERKLQTPVFSRAQFNDYLFVDSGWFGGIAGGLKVPIEYQMGIIRLNDSLVSLNTGLSIGVLPTSQGFYSGITIGMGVHYNGELQGFYSALYPLYDILWLQETSFKRSTEWQVAIDLLGFDFDLTPLLPVQIGTYFRVAVAWLSGAALPAVEIGATVGYHFIR